MKLPSSRRKKRPDEKLNLVPIMDSVFIFIFFLLMSAQFIHVMEIGSPIPIVSDQEPPKPEKEPLALQLIIQEKELVLTKGLNKQVIGEFPRAADGTYALDELHTKLLEVKKLDAAEETIIFQPEWDLAYDDIVQIMDSVRMLKKTDDAFFMKDKDGVDVKVKTLFAKIIFGNLMS